MFEINNCEYFAPLSSPEEKHKKMKNTVDFFKIKGGELGAVNFNNMIPVTNKNYKLVDLNKKTETVAELKYQKLLKEQLEWLNANLLNYINCIIVEDCQKKCKWDVAILNCWKQSA